MVCALRVENFQNMMMMTDCLHKLRWAVAALCLLGGLTANAVDFVADGLAYNFLNGSTVEVTSTVRIGVDFYVDYSQGPIWECEMWVVDGENYYGLGDRNVYPKGVNYPGLTGAVVIPAQVEYCGATYTVTRISDYAFAFTDITSVELPATITDVGQSAFEACEQLSAVYISDLEAWCRIDFTGGEWFGRSSYGDIFSWTQVGGLLSSGNPTEYARHLYLNGKEVTSATVPEGITRLGYTFQNCINLTEATLPTTVTDLGVYTFAGTGITRLPLTEAIDRIPDGTFSDCPSLPDTVVIPANIKFINRSAFSHSPIDCLFLPATIRLMDTRSFEATGLRHIFSPAYLAPCTINTLDDPHGGWSAFDEPTYSDAVLHIPPGADYADRFDETMNEYISGWTWFEHIEEYGDVNGDSRVDVDDLNIVINVILDMNQEPATVALCDVDGSGHVDVDDLNLLINAILGAD